MHDHDLLTIKMTCLRKQHEYIQSVIPNMFRQLIDITITGAETMLTKLYKCTKLLPESSTLASMTHRGSTHTTVISDERILFKIRASLNLSHNPVTQHVCAARI